MGRGSFANFDAYEGTVNGETVITFKQRPRKIIITNDDAGGNLEFRFNDSETLATLKPTETVTLDIIAATCTLRGNGVNYRVWGVG